MKKFILIIIAFLAVLQLNAQYPVKVGDTDGFANNLPYNNQYDYNWCTTIYPQDRINVHGDIIKLSYKLSSIIDEITPNQRIYMATTSDVEFTDAGYPNTASMTLVYDGTIIYEHIQIAGVTEITLTTPFSYDNTESLIIHLENRDGTKNINSNEGFSDEADYSYTTNMCKYNQQDGSFPATTGTLTTQMPVVYLGFDSGLDVGINSINDNTSDLLPGINDLSLNFRNYMGDTITTCDIEWELNGTLQTTINWTGTVYPGQVSPDILLLDDYDFAPATYQIKAWTSNPNSGTDELNTNDTMTVTILVADYIEIADDSYTGNNSWYVPFYRRSWQGWSASIINKDSVYLDRKICGLAYNVVSDGSSRNNQTVFLSHIADNFHQTTAMPDETSMTNMFSGTVDYTGTGWKKIPFDNIFEYNNSENIMIYYTDKSNQWQSPGTHFDASVYGGNVGLYKNNDASQEFPTDNGSLTARLPNIRLYCLIPGDAGISLLNSPGTYFNTGNNNISVSLKNFGTDTLKSANINYQIDNGTINTFNWTGDLPCYNTEQNIIIGNESLTYGEHTIKTWTDSPNGLNDYKSENDTLFKTIYATDPLCGTYVIGSLPSDYLTLKEAVDSLNSCGVSCDVVFDIKSGTYNSQYTINEINDAGQNSTVTFKSQTGDSTDVVLTTDSTDYLFNLNGADYLRFKHLTFTSDSAEKFMVLDSGACNNIFENNQFIDGVYQLYNTATTIVDTNNVIENNYFSGGTRAIYLNSSVMEANNKVISNTFINQTTESIYISYQDNYIISANKISNNNARATYVYVSQNGLFEKNIISVDDINNEPVYFFGNNDTTLIINNFIKCDNVTYGAIKLSGSYFIFSHNTVVCSKSWDGLGVLNIYQDDKLIYNNIIISKGSGSAIYIAAGETNNILDYNCLFSTTSNPIGEWNNTKCTTLAEWQATSGLDLNSISILPDFFSETDLHTNTLAIDGKGTPLPEITDDIDGETRNASNPDIGADEFTSTCSGVLSGTYIIGASSDYLTFNDAVYALRNCGVNGSVLFNVKNNTYNEQVNIDGFIPGYTENDTIIFQSQSGDSTSVILTYKADTLNNYTLKLSGSDRFVFKQITIQSEDATYGRVIEIGNGACNNLIKNCVITGVVSTDDNKNLSLIHFFEDNTYRDTSNIIKGNRLVNGSYGIYLMGNNSGNKETFNTISGNYFINQSAYSIYAGYQINLLITENNFENNYDIDFDFYGIQNENSDSTLITKNIFNLQRDYNISALCIMNYMNYNLIANNFISVSSNTASAKGIFYAGYNTKIYYNSININGGSSSSLAIDVSYSTQNADIKNNIFANNAGGYAIKYLFAQSAVLSSDFNNLYSSGEYIAYWLGTNISNLTEWQSSTGFGNNSVSSYPNFISDTDLHTSNVLLNNAATPLPEVPIDIDDETRDATTPDIGADEFTGVTFSLGDDVTVCVDAEYKIDAGEGFDTYLWSTGANLSYILVDSTGTGYGSKEYFVTVTLDGNSYEDSVTVTFSSPIAAPVNYFCFDENTDSVLITAGDGLYYNWSTGETTQSIWTSASYVSVTVTDANGCEDSDYIYRQWNSCPANFTMPDDTTICNNGSIILDANPNCSADYTNYSYLWNTGATTDTIRVYASGITGDYSKYNLTVTYHSTNINCTSIDSVSVYKNLCPANFDMPADTTIYVGETLVLDANSTSCSADYNNYSYLWNTNETTETITVDATALGIGSYTYSVSVTNNITTSNCITTDMITVNVSNTSAIETLVMENISIYPNPTDGILKLEFSNIIENTWIRIINVTGQVVYSEYLKNLTGIKTLDLSELDKGVYILSIQNKNTILTNKITLY